MSARAPRRSFATPFVLTLAAVPAACVTSNQPPPSSPQPQAQHEPDHVNPPKPQQATEPAEWHTGTTGTNHHVKGTASTGSTTVAQTQPAPASNPSPAPEKPRGYRQWTVTRSGTTCSSMVKVHCPEGAMCNPPPPAKYECPKQLAENGRMDVIQRVEKGDCYVDYGEMSCPQGATCNPPPPQKVACPK